MENKPSPSVDVLHYVESRLSKISDGACALFLIVSVASILLDESDEAQQAGALRSVTSSLDGQIGELLRDVRAMQAEPIQFGLRAPLGAITQPQHGRA